MSRNTCRAKLFREPGAQASSDKAPLFIGHVCLTIRIPFLSHIDVLLSRLIYVWICIFTVVIETLRVILRLKLKQLTFVRKMNRLSIDGIAQNFYRSNFRLTRANDFNQSRKRDVDRVVMYIAIRVMRVWLLIEYKRIWRIGLRGTYH